MNEKKFEALGRRLEEERERLGIKNKSAMAVLGGVAPSAYGNYAEGIRAPDGGYPAAIAAAGADVQYILTGAHSVVLAPDERMLLGWYREAGNAGKDEILDIAMGRGKAGRSVQNIADNHGQISGKIINNQIGVGNGKKKGEGKG